MTVTAFGRGPKRGGIKPRTRASLSPSLRTFLSPMLVYETRGGIPNYKDNS